MTRQQRRRDERLAVKQKHAESTRKFTLTRRKPKPQHPIYLQAKAAAVGLLMTGPRAQAPGNRAVEKTARWLLTSPLHAWAARHMRGGWRSWNAAAGHRAKEALTNV